MEEDRRAPVPRRQRGSLPAPPKGVDIEVARLMGQQPKTRRFHWPKIRVKFPSFSRNHDQHPKIQEVATDMAASSKPNSFFTVSAQTVKRWLGAAMNAVFDFTQFGQNRLPPVRGVGGWRPRHWVYEISRHRWNFGATRSQRDERAIATIKRRQKRCLTFATFSRGGGGVGKSVKASVLAQTLAACLPHAKVLLVDNHRIGTIGALTGISREGSIACVQASEPEKACFTLLEACARLGELTSTSIIGYRFPILEDSGLFVLAYPEKDQLSGELLIQFKQAMEQFFDYIVFDGHVDDGQENTHAMLETVDAIAVLTKRRNVSRITQAAEAIKLLRDQPPYKRRHNRAVLVVNQVWLNPLHWWGTGRTVNMLNKALGEEFGGPVATLPSSFLVSTGKKFKLVNRSSRFRRAAAEAAALMIETAVQNIGPDNPDGAETTTNSSSGEMAGYSAATSSV